MSDLTCAHVLDVIDGTPVVDLPLTILDAVRLHTGRCHACGAALAAAESIPRRVDRLSVMTGSPGMAAGVMARIAAIEPTASPDASPTAATPLAIPAAGWWTWATTLTAAAVGLASAGHIGWAAPHGLQGLPPSLPPVSTQSSDSTVLAVLLIVYVLVLFALVRKKPQGVVSR